MTASNNTITKSRKCSQVYILHYRHQNTTFQLMYFKCFLSDRR